MIKSEILPEDVDYIEKGLKYRKVKTITYYLINDNSVFRLYSLDQRTINSDERLILILVVKGNPKSSDINERSYYTKQNERHLEKFHIENFEREQIYVPGNL